jgi:hypothetical protein
MPNLSIRRTIDLTLSDRQVVEGLLGRELADDEEVGIWASRPHEPPAASERKEAWERLNRHLEFMASKTAGAPVDELERLADEVSDEIRHGRG